MFSSTLICLLPLVMCETKPRSNNGIEYDGTSNIRYQPPDPPILPHFTVTTKVAIPASEIQTILELPLSLDVPVASYQSSTPTESEIFLESRQSQAQTQIPLLVVVSQSPLSSTTVSPETTVTQSLVSIQREQESIPLLETASPLHSNLDQSTYEQLSYPLKLQLSFLPTRDYDIKSRAITQIPTITFSQSPIAADTFSLHDSDLQSSCTASLIALIDNGKPQVVSAPCFYAIMRLIKSHQLSLNVASQYILSNALLALANATQLSTTDSGGLGVSLHKPGIQKINNFSSRLSAFTMPVDMVTQTQEVSASHELIQQNTNSQSLQSTASQSFLNRTSQSFLDTASQSILNVDTQPSNAVTTFQSMATNASQSYFANDRHASETSHSEINSPIAFEIPVQIKTDQVSYESESALKQTQISTSKTEVTSQSQVETTRQTAISEPLIAVPETPITGISPSLLTTNNTPELTASLRTTFASLESSLPVASTATQSQEVTMSHAIIHQNASSQSLQSTASQSFLDTTSQSFLNVDTQPSPTDTNFQSTATIASQSYFANDRHASEASHAVINSPIAFEIPVQIKTDQVSYESESALKQTQISTSKTEVTSQLQVETTRQSAILEPLIAVPETPIAGIPPSLLTTNNTPELTTSLRTTFASLESSLPVASTATQSQEVTMSHAIIHQNASSQSLQSTASQSFLDTTSQSFLNVDTQPSPTDTNFESTATIASQTYFANDRHASEASHAVINSPIAFEIPVQIKTDQVSYESESALKRTQISTSKTEVTSQLQVETTRQSAISEPLIAVPETTIAGIPPSLLTTNNTPELTTSLRTTFASLESSLPVASTATQSQEVTMSHAIIHQNASSQSLQSTASQSFLDTTSQSFLNVDTQPSPTDTNFQSTATIASQSYFANDRHASEASHAVINSPIAFEIPVQIKTDQVSYESESALKQTQISTSKTELTSQLQVETTRQSAISEPLIAVPETPIAGIPPSLLTTNNTPELTTSLRTTFASLESSLPVASTATQSQEVTMSHAIIHQNASSQTLQSTASQSFLDITSQSFLNVDTQPSPTDTNFQSTATIASHSYFANDRHASEASHAVINSPIAFEIPVQIKTDQVSYESDSALKRTQISTSKTEVTSQLQVETTRQSAISEPLIAVPETPIAGIPPSLLTTNNTPELTTSLRTTFASLESSLPVASTATQSQEVTMSHAIIHQNASSQSLQSTASQSFLDTTSQSYLNVDTQPSPAVTNFQSTATNVSQSYFANDRQTSEAIHSEINSPIAYEISIQTNTDPFSYESQLARKQTQISTSKTDVTSQSQVETTRHTAISEPLIVPETPITGITPTLLTTNYTPRPELTASLHPTLTSLEPSLPGAFTATQSQEATVSHEIIQQNTTSQSFLDTSSQSFLNVDTQPSPADTNFQSTATNASQSYFANDRHASEASHAVINSPIAFEIPVQIKTDQVSYESESALKQTQISTSKTELTSQSQVETTRQTAISEPLIAVSETLISGIPPSLLTTNNTPELTASLRTTFSSLEPSLPGASTATQSQEATVSHEIIQQNTTSQSLQSTTSQSFLDTSSQSFLNVDTQPSPAVTNFQSTATNASQSYFANDRHATEPSHTVINSPITFEIPIQAKTDQVSYETESALKQTQINTSKIEESSQSQEETTRQAAISDPLIVVPETYTAASQLFLDATSKSFLNVATQPSPTVINSQPISTNASQIYYANDRQSSEAFDPDINSPIVYEISIQTTTDPLSYESQSTRKQTQIGTSKTEVISKSQVDTSDQIAISESLIAVPATPTASIPQSLLIANNTLRPTPASQDPSLEASHSVYNTMTSEIPKKEFTFVSKPEPITVLQLDRSSETNLISQSQEQIILQPLPKSLFSIPTKSWSSYKNRPKPLRSHPFQPLSKSVSLATNLPLFNISQSLLSLETAPASSYFPVSTFQPERDLASHSEGESSLQLNGSVTTSSLRTTLASLESSLPVKSTGPQSQDVTVSHATLQQNTSSQSFQSTADQSFLDTSSQSHLNVIEPSPALTYSQLVAVNVSQLNIASDRKPSKACHSVTSLPITSIQTETDLDSHEFESAAEQKQTMISKTEVTSPSQVDITHQPIMSKPTLHFTRESISESKNLQSKPMLLIPGGISYSQQQTHTKPYDSPPLEIAAPETSSVPPPEIVGNTRRPELTTFLPLTLDSLPPSLVTASTPSGSQPSLNVLTQTDSKSRLFHIPRPRPLLRSHPFRPLSKLAQQPITSQLLNVSHWPLSPETATTHSLLDSTLQPERDPISQAETELRLQSNSIFPIPKPSSVIIFETPTKNVSQSIMVNTLPKVTDSLPPTLTSLQPLLTTAPSLSPTTITQLNAVPESYLDAFLRRGPPAVEISQLILANSTQLSVSDRYTPESFHSVSSTSNASQTLVQPEIEGISYVLTWESLPKPKFISRQEIDPNSQSQTKITHQPVLSEPTLHLERESISQSETTLQSKPNLGRPEQFTYSLQLTHTKPYDSSPLQLAAPETTPASDPQTQIVENTSRTGLAIWPHTFTSFQPSFDAASARLINSASQSQEVTVSHGIMPQNAISQPFLNTASQQPPNDLLQPAPVTISQSETANATQLSISVDRPTTEDLHSLYKPMTSSNIVKPEPIPKPQLARSSETNLTSQSQVDITLPSLAKSQFSVPTKSRPYYIPRPRPLSNSTPQAKHSPLINVLLPPSPPDSASTQSFVDSTLQTERKLVSLSKTEPPLQSNTVSVLEPSSYQINLEPQLTVMPFKQYNSRDVVVTPLLPMVNSSQSQTIKILPEISTSLPPILDYFQPSLATASTVPTTTTTQLQVDAEHHMTIQRNISAQSSENNANLSSLDVFLQSAPAGVAISQLTTANSTQLTGTADRPTPKAYSLESELLPKITLIRPQDMNLTSQVQIDSPQYVPKPIIISEREPLLFHEAGAVADAHFTGAAVASSYQLKTPQVPMPSVNRPDSFTLEVKSIQEKNPVPETKLNPIFRQPVKSTYPLKLPLKYPRKLQPSLMAVSGSESKRTNAKLPATLPSVLPKHKTTWQPAAFGRQSHRTTEYTIATSVQRTAGFKKRKSKVTGQCLKQYGLFPMKDGDCSKYIMCNAGVASIMNCPAGLVFNPTIQNCDWLANVPQCNSQAFKDYKCPNPTIDDSSLDSDMIFKYKYGQHCKLYIACQKGYPRLLSCANGQAFDDVTHSCIKSEYVQGCTTNTV